MVRIEFESGAPDWTITFPTFVIRPCGVIWKLIIWVKYRENETMVMWGECSEGRYTSCYIIVLELVLWATDYIHIGLLRGVWYKNDHWSCEQYVSRYHKG